MGTEAGFRASSGDAAQRTKNARRAEDEDPEGFWEGWRKAIEYHSGIVEDIRRQPIPLALWLERASQPMSENNCSDAAHALLEHRQQDCGSRGCRGVTNAET